MNAILLALLVVVVGVVVLLVGRVCAARAVEAAALTAELYEEAAAASIRRFEKEAMRRNHSLYLAKEARVDGMRVYMTTLAKGAGYSEAFRGHPADLVLLQAPGRKTWILRSDLRDQVLDMIEEDLAS